MKIKPDRKSTVANAGDVSIVSWEPRYATGIEQIDVQHRRLVFLTNELYKACRTGGNTALQTVFEDAMHSMVEYVRFHFRDEVELLQCIKYPGFAAHKKEHESLIKNILDAAKDYDEGKKFVPNSFVRTLKDWVFGHIAVSDRLYSLYVEDQKKKGLLTDQDLMSCSLASRK